MFFSTVREVRGDGALEGLEKHPLCLYIKFCETKPQTHTAVNLEIVLESIELPVLFQQ